MEGISVNAYRGIRSYWSIRKYQRLDGSGGTTRRRARVELRSTTAKRRRRFWRIKITPRVKLKLFGINLRSPKKVLVWLRDAYVRMMLGFANTRVCSRACAHDTGIAGFGRAPLKEYDKKMILQIYSSLMLAQNQLAPREAGNKLGSERVPRAVLN